MAGPSNTRILCSEHERPLGSTGSTQRQARGDLTVLLHGSAQVELVAFRVAHRDVEMIVIGDPPDD